LQAAMVPIKTRSKDKISSESVRQTQTPMQQSVPKEERTVLSLATALSLYGLKDSELFWELQLDTRCLMGWNTNKIVVSFRGTVSMKNAVADMQVSCLQSLPSAAAVTRAAVSTEYSYFGAKLPPSKVTGLGLSSCCSCE